MNDSVRKGFLSFFKSCSISMVFAMLGLAWAQSAFAMTTLKQVQVSNSAQVDLLFDGKVNKSQIQTEFFNDIIQLSMVDVTVYPAKISSVNGGLLTKVFAYQYAPRLVRCRLTVNGKAENYKDRLSISSNGRMLTVRISDGKSDRVDTVELQASAPVRAAVGADEKSLPPKASPAMDEEEKVLLQRVMDAPVQHPATKGKGTAESGKKENSLKGEAREKDKDRESAKSKTAGTKIGGARPLPSLTGVLMKLGFVMGIFGIFALMLRKFMGARSGVSAGRKIGGVSEKEMASALGGRGVKGALGGIGRFFQSNFGRIGQKERLIEVLSNHQLGPKQSIAVVRVCGKKMVIGIANDSISLISQLAPGIGAEGADDELDFEAALSEGALGISKGAGATAAGPALFAELLKNEKSRPSVGATPYGRPAAPAPDLGVRARIRSRLEGLKPL